MILAIQNSALAAALTGLVLGCTAISADTGGKEADGHPLTCTVGIAPAGDMLAVEGVLSAEDDVSGTYQLTVTRRGTALNQGGPFALAAGETERLGHIRLNGPSAGLEAELTVEIDGKPVPCTVDL